MIINKDMENLKMNRKRTKKIEFFFMEGQDDEIKSKQAPKRDDFK